MSALALTLPGLGPAGARPGRAGAPLAGRLTALAQLEAQLHLLGARAVALGPLGLDHQRQLLKPGLGQGGRKAALAEVALGDVCGAVAVCAQRRLAVVEMHRSEPLEPQLAVELVDRLAPALGCADV